jgi:hypothetical protein
MTLTTEEVIQKEKLLSGFIPFVQIAIELEQLPWDSQIAFFCSCAERILPTYMLVNGQDGWGDISILRSVTDDLWQIVGKTLSSENEIEALSNKVDQIFIEDEEDEGDGYIRDCFYYAWGEDVPEYLKLVLNYIASHDIDVYCSIFTHIVYIVHEYYGMYFPNIDSEWELKKNKEERNQIILNSQLLQTEIAKELADLELLKNTPELTAKILSTFRANACPNSVSILGSLDEVRANLE